MKTRLAILGSTGSIGVNTLDVVRRLETRFEVAALSADSNIRLLSEQAKHFRPNVVCVGNRSLTVAMKNLVPPKTKVLFGTEGLKEIVSSPDNDLVVFAIAGLGCLIPLFEAIKRGKRIALANKEALVSGGPVVMREAEKRGVRIIPIDSEHSAIFQCLEGKRARPSKIYLTGSGGPLLRIDKSKFDKLPKSFILKHPKWKMGKKISVDSATMMNKGLEVIEAKYLFGVDEKSIEILIHPEAVIHSMVELVDGSIFAQLSLPDMRLPIQYALTYPERMKSRVKKIDFAKIAKLSFFKPDSKKFPCMGLAREAAKSGGTAPAVLCAADEEAVKFYLAGRIRFSEIPKIIEHLLKRHKNVMRTSLSVDDILEAEKWAREEARSICYH